MTSIYDIYNLQEECCATPSNTIGIGNPMLPTAEESGTEPLIPTAKTKTEKKQKRKTVKEGMLSGIETTLQAGDDAMQFIEWFATQYQYAYKSSKKEDIIKALIPCVSFENKNTVVIDIEQDKEGDFADILVIKDKLPANIKTIKVYNCRYSLSIQSYVGDLSNFDVIVFKDNGKSFSDIYVSVKNKITSIELGKIECDKLTVRSSSAESLSFNNDSIVLELSICECFNLKSINGQLHHIQSIELTDTFVYNYLAQSGFIPWGTALDIRKTSLKKLVIR